MADDAVAPTPLLADRLGGEEVDHPFFATSSQPQRDGIAQVKLLAALSFRLDDLLVAENGEVIRVGCFGADHGVVQHVPAGLYLVLGYDRTLRVAQEPRVDPREMAEVGEILDLPGGVALPVERAGENDFLLVVFQLGQLGQRKNRVSESHPDDPVAFQGPVAGNPCLGWNPGIGLLRNFDACALGVVVPSMVRARQAVILERAQGESGATVDT